jgi:hypothetical protein
MVSGVLSPESVTTPEAATNPEKIKFVRKTLETVCCYR